VTSVHSSQPPLWYLMLWLVVLIGVLKVASDTLPRLVVPVIGLAAVVIGLRLVWFFTDRRL
jgi:hypothetical protein